MYPEGPKVSLIGLVQGTGPVVVSSSPIHRALDPNGQVIVSEPAQLRHEFAVKNGADLVLRGNVDMIASVLAATNGAGVDVAFDAAGEQVTLDTALRALRARGQLVVVSSWEKSPVIDFTTVVVKEINIIG